MAEKVDYEKLRKWGYDRRYTNSGVEVLALLDELDSLRAELKSSTDLWEFEKARGDSLRADKERLDKALLKARRHLKGAAGLAIDLDSPRYVEEFDGAIDAIDSARTQENKDPMHPTGKCTCCGEGTCEWCARTQEKDQ